MRYTEHLGLVFLLCAGACTSRLWSTPQPEPMKLPVFDPRAALVGTWDVEFQVDSTNHGTLEPGAIVRGSLIVSDTIFRYGSDAIKGNANFDLRVSCFRPGPGEFLVALRGDTVTIDFTPQARNCGLGAQGRIAGDTINGRWHEQASVGVASAGTVRMIRRRS